LAAGGLRVPAPLPRLGLRLLYGGGEPDRALDHRLARHRRRVPPPRRADQVGGRGRRLGRPRRGIHDERGHAHVGARRPSHVDAALRAAHHVRRLQPLRPPLRGGRPRPRRDAAPGTRIVAVNPPVGPESIEGFYDDALAVPGLLAEIAKGEAQGVSAHVIACFDDTGLDAARALAAAPVVGIGEAAFHAASLVAGRFSVVTTLARSIPAIEHNLVRYGLASRCARVRAAEVPVLSLEEPGPP